MKKEEIWKTTGSFKSLTQKKKKRNMEDHGFMEAINCGTSEKAETMEFSGSAEN